MDGLLQELATQWDQFAALASQAEASEDEPPGPVGPVRPIRRPGREDYWCRRIIDVSSFLRIIDVSPFFAEKRADINNHVHYLPLMTRPDSIHATSAASTTPGSRDKLETKGETIA